LGLISEGYGNREIAQHLTIELGTAKNHVHNILEKLSVKTRRDAAIYYTLGLV
jgi:two-component system nitrate/nitrite response regulator NarL